MRVVVALGGNALLRRGEAMTAENQRKNARIAAEALAPLYDDGHEVVITHGNGPQVGLLALQGAAYEQVEAYPLDVLGAETVGMIGYMIEQELGNLLPFEKPFATILTQVEVDPNDPAFKDPTKPIGPLYSKEEAERLADEKGWSIREDGDKWRRVVPSPLPKHIFEIRPIKWLLDHDVLVIAAGGGGIPTMYNEEKKLIGVECVIDKDRCSGLLAKEIDADVYIMATDADAVYLDWGTPSQRAIKSASPDALDAYGFAAGSMGPKVEAAQTFARQTGKKSVICTLAEVPQAILGEKGTSITTATGDTTFY
ncbi:MULTISPECIES: carbamate kinase [unclassified Pseudovibrio]|uniref:carbamate kinase n=1 Tax=unclassified Pseudovibrio TaxID=2627060 RepID=UPI0007AEC5F0|nr:MULTISPECIES: carbamate kinase [unclassified Pseudovibrio]KZK92341.1 Carbamate kinase 1 [Pseudovibrio sp. W74]KZL11062.1 Carbamate kinase 1 [Pseudovibrio sp. Ad14]